jgi:ADP-ribosyl-[dinitrogen reductase] hydrolase
MNLEKSIIGCILGTAIGDAIALPYEGLSKPRQKRLFPSINSHNLIFGKGMFSDDTEHTCMVAQSLIFSGGDLQKFTKFFAWELRLWLLTVPAGIGFATLRGICKLWIGIKPEKAGVFSAGNGPAMRSAILGVCYGDDLPKLRSLISISTRMTHTDIKAEYGALAIAIAAYLSSKEINIIPEIYYKQLANIIPEATEILTLIKAACESANNQESSEEFAEKMRLSKGITGYIYHTVPVVIQTWLRHQENYQQGILEIIKCGGDTDTTAAILGGIIGARVGKDGIPEHWLNNIWEYPRNINFMIKLGKRLTEVVAEGTAKKPLFLPIYIIFVRNLLFTFVVILHGLRRLFPPY